VIRSVSEASSAVTSSCTPNRAAATVAAECDYVRNFHRREGGADAANLVARKEPVRRPYSQYTRTQRGPENKRKSMTVDEIPAGLSAFLAGLQARDATRAAAQLAEYVILESPIAAEPIVGRGQVANVVARLFDVIDEFTVVEIISGDGHFAVVANIKMGTIEIDGIDLIGINAQGKVASLSIHLRPMRAVVALQNRLAPALAMPVLTLTEEH